MIFCTVGTHEDPFDRLVRALDELPGDEEVVIQSGYSTWAARRASCVKMMPFGDVQDHMRRARVVVTHGGPASIMQALALGKVPIVVPRQSAFGEHVDDHQVRFARRLADRVLVVLDIAELAPAIAGYEARVRDLGGADGGVGRARAFAERFDALCDDVLTGKRRRA